MARKPWIYRNIILQTVLRPSMIDVPLTDAYITKGVRKTMTLILLFFTSLTVFDFVFHLLFIDLKPLSFKIQICPVRCVRHILGSECRYMLTTRFGNNGQSYVVLHPLHISHEFDYFSFSTRYFFFFLTGTIL